MPDNAHTKTKILSYPSVEVGKTSYPVHELLQKDTWAPPVLVLHPVFVAFTLLLQTYATRRDEIVDIAIHVAPKIISLGLRVTMKFPKQTVLNPVSPVIVSTTIPKRTEVGIGCI